MSDQPLEEDKLLELLKDGKYLPPIYYEPDKKTYWDKDHNGGWTELNEGGILRRLDIKYQITNARKKSKRYSVAEICLDTVQDRQKIIFSGGIAGLDAGTYDVPEGKYLVTYSRHKPVPVQGDWSAIKTLGERMFGPEQIDYVWGWHQRVVKAYASEDRIFTQAFFMAGPPNCGKSFWQHLVITPILGGKMAANPLQYMTKQTSFNKELIETEHWALDDAAGGLNYHERRLLGAGIKMATVNKNQTCHPKGKTAFTVSSRHWLSASLNDEVENISMLPEMDESLVDKFQLLKCTQAINAEWPGDENAIQRLEKSVAEQIPAFIYWLLNEYEVPEALKDGRFGVKAYQNPELVSKIDNAKPAADLQELIDIRFEEVFEKRGFIIADHLSLEKDLREDTMIGPAIKRILDGGWGKRSLSHMLSALKAKHPTRYEYQDGNRRPRPWVIIGEGKTADPEQVKLVLRDKTKWLVG